MILNFANKKRKKYYILRLFNIYGDNRDKFSFIEKVIVQRKEIKK